LKALEQESDALTSLVKEGGAAQNGLYNILSDIHEQLEESTKNHKDAAEQEANAFLLVTNAALQKFSEQLTDKHSVLTDMLADYINDIKRTTSEQQNQMEQLRVNINVGIESEVRLPWKETLTCPLLIFLHILTHNSYRKHSFKKKKTNSSRLFISNSKAERKPKSS
jgi:hypothetical protein